MKVPGIGTSRIDSERPSSDSKLFSALSLPTGTNLDELDGRRHQMRAGDHVRPAGPPPERKLHSRRLRPDRGVESEHQQRQQPTPHGPVDLLEDQLRGRQGPAECRCHRQARSGTARSPCRDRAHRQRNTLRYAQPPRRTAHRTVIAPPRVRSVVAIEPSANASPPTISTPVGLRTPRRKRRLPRLLLLSRQLIPRRHFTVTGEQNEILHIHLLPSHAGDRRRHI